MEQFTIGPISLSCMSRNPAIHQDIPSGLAKLVILERLSIATEFFAFTGSRAEEPLKPATLSNDPVIPRVPGWDG